MKMDLALNKRERLRLEYVEKLATRRDNTLLDVKRLLKVTEGPDV